MEENTVIARSERSAFPVIARSDREPTESARRERRSNPFSSKEQRPMAKDCFARLRRACNDGAVISRIYITPTGDLVVSDLWDEIQHMLTEKGDFSEID